MTVQGTPQFFVDGQRPLGTESLSEEHMRALADAMPQIVWSARPDGYLDYYNARWYDYTGLPRGEGGDESWKPVLHPEDAGPCVEAWYRAVRTGQPYQIEYRLRDRRTGTYRWHLGRALPIKTETGGVERWFGTCTDIHEYKEAQRKLERQTRALSEADRRKDEFLAILAHELRNPLASVVSAVALLRAEDAEERAWATEVIGRQAGQLTRLIDDLLDVARINRGKVRLNKNPLDLATVLDRAVETTRSTIAEQQHALAVDYPRGELFVDGDSVRLEQIVVNLLTNAAKYTLPRGNLSLRAGRRDGEVWVVVEDDGVGISAEKLPEIFGLFSQGEGGDSASKDGLGIGLTIVQKLVELHGGTVAVASPGRGQGATFTVVLPAATATEASPPAPTESAATAEPKAARILVVDDHVDCADGLARLLRRRGHAVQTAYNGSSVLAIADEFRPEVILLDLELPEMDGCEVAPLLRQNVLHLDCLLIALTGYGQEEDRKRCREAGFDHHALKPVDLALLDRFISEFLSKRPVN